MVDPLKEAFLQGQLKTRSVSPDGETQWKRVAQIFCHELPWETWYSIHTAHGKLTVTSQHRIFTSPTTKTKAEDLKVGDTVLSLGTSLEVLAVEKVESRTHAYDLTVEDWHNFMVEDSRVVVSNSPDKFYHFRPPEHEGRIGSYNRIFGQVWEDQELELYLRLAISDWSVHPPLTPVFNLEYLQTQYAQWKGPIYWAAIYRALFALTTNWIGEEFSLEGSQKVRVKVGDETFDLPIEELYAICK